MELHRIKYPLAVLTATGKIVHASEVANGIGCMCHCKFCSESLIAINNEDNKQTDHFRHNANTNCKANYETYIHWLCKEIIKSLEYIILPEISTKEILIEESILIARRTILKTYGLENLYFQNSIVQSTQKLYIVNCRDEVRFDTPLGDVVADIVISNNGQELFIEPFLTNPISREKNEKLLELDKSVITIDLSSFILANDYLFTLDNFRDFVQNGTSSKQWHIIRKEKKEKLITAYLNGLENMLRSKAHQINKRKELQQEIASCSQEILNHYQIINNLKNQIFTCQTEQKEIEAALGVND